MGIPAGAVPVWFGRGQQDDLKYLQEWRSALLTYSINDDLDSNWNIDRYDIILGRDSSGTLFQDAAELTLHNCFYPPEVLQATSDYDIEHRTVRSGDHIVQRIHVLQIAGKPLLDMLTMNRITEVFQEPRRVGFTYTTTTAHIEVGEWSPRVEWRENNDVALVIEVASRIRPGTSAFARSLTRRMQLRGHKLSICNFLFQLTGEMPVEPIRDSQSAVPSLLPVAMLSTALILFLGALLGFMRNDRN